jgi:hypothetical protein
MMPFFPILQTENKVQVFDKLRLSGVKSFSSKGEEQILKVSIEPNTLEGFIDVTGTSEKDWYLDWAYSTPGEKVATIKLEGETITETSSCIVTCLSEEEDKLFSSDEDLTQHEYDILSWLPEGKSSYKYVHRAAQERILAYLDEKGFVDVYGDKFTLSSVIDTGEFNQWSKFLTLRLIFESLSNATDDIFHKKAERYYSLSIQARNRVFIRIDTNKSGTLENYEGINFSGSVLRR